MDVHRPLSVGVGAEGISIYTNIVSIYSYFKSVTLEHNLLSVVAEGMASVDIYSSIYSY